MSTLPCQASPRAGWAGGVWGLRAPLRREHRWSWAVPAAGHDGCHPQEVLGLALLGGLREIQLHGEAVRQGASWEWGAEPGDLCHAGESPAAKRGGGLDWFCLSIPNHLPRWWGCVLPTWGGNSMCPSPFHAPALARRSWIGFTVWRGGLTRERQALGELAGLLGFTAASLGDFGHLVPFLPVLKKVQTTWGLAEGS